MRKKYKEFLIRTKKLVENKQYSIFGDEDILLIDELISMDYLKVDSFTKMTGGRRVYKLNKIYPLTEKALNELNKNWYYRLRENLIIEIIRDIFALIGFIATIIYTIKMIINK